MIREILHNCGIYLLMWYLFSLLILYVFRLHLHLFSIFLHIDVCVFIVEVAYVVCKENFRKRKQGHARNKHFQFDADGGTLLRVSQVRICIGYNFAGRDAEPYLHSVCDCI